MKKKSLFDKMAKVEELKFSDETYDIVYQKGRIDGSMQEKKSDALKNLGFAAATFLAMAFYSLKQNRANKIIQRRINNNESLKDVIIEESPEVNFEDLLK